MRAGTTSTVHLVGVRAFAAGDYFPTWQPAGYGQYGGGMPHVGRRDPAVRDHRIQDTDILNLPADAETPQLREEQGRGVPERARRSRGNHSE